MQVLQGVGAIHSQGIIYRDLKPENIVMSKDGYIKLADFGMSVKTEQSRECHGTPAYMATEMFTATSKPYGKEVDWWAFGQIISEIAFGEPLFYSKDTVETSRGILFKDAKQYIFGKKNEELQEGSKVVYTGRKGKEFRGEITEINRDGTFEIALTNKGRKTLRKDVTSNQFKSWYEEWEGCPEDLLDLILKLLHKTPEKRLGANGYEEVMQHRFFHKYMGKDMGHSGWEALKQKELEAPPIFRSGETFFNLSGVEKTLKAKGFVQKDGAAPSTALLAQGESDPFRDF